MYGSCILFGIKKKSQTEDFLFSKFSQNGITEKI